MLVPEHETWVLNRRESEAFVEALLNPSAPGDALREAAARYRSRSKDVAL
jgi:uncharacterized protein (DUF1778 family)